MSPHPSPLPPAKAGLRGRTVQEIRRCLLRWYDKTRRDLPWRRSHNAYVVWISETMLQQTQVKTVLRYYKRFLDAFPTLKALDRASMERVLTYWAGLGYYRRPENLKAAARKIIREHGGRIPRDFKTLRGLPGIGDYTAGALMSIAYNQPYPAVDGNARRILARLFDPQESRDPIRLARLLISPARPGDFNQAMMDLGATVCLARQPICGRCPLARFCSARKSREFHRDSSTKAKRPFRNVEWPLAVIVKNERILLRQRAAGPLLSGLWEVPGGPKKSGESTRAALGRHLNGLADSAPRLSKVGELRHQITCNRIRAPLFAGSGGTGVNLPDRSWRWVSLSSLKNYPVSALSLKAIRAFYR